MLTTSNLGLKKPEGTDVVNIADFNYNADIIDTALSTANIYPTAGGTATVITLTLPATLTTGYAKTFIASASNSGSATTINGKSLYKPSTTTSPNLVAGKAYTFWYNSTSNCFFIKASAEGNTIAPHVLAGDTFSNKDDTGLVGTMPNNGALSSTISTAGGTYTIPSGYTTGGTITAPSLTTVTADGTVTSNAQILSGYKCYSNGTLYTGTIASKTAQTYSPSTTAQTIASGQYLSGIQTISAITGTTGVADVLATKTFSSANGISLTGTMINNGAVAITPSTINQAIPVGYHNGSGYVAGDADLIASNILNTANIFNVQGTANVAPSILTKCVSIPSWSFIASSMPTARMALGCAGYNGKIYCISGQTQAGYVQTLEIYDTVSNSWTTGASIPVTLTDFACVAYNGKIYCFSGAYSYIYNIASNTWSTGAIMIYQTAQINSTVYNGKIYVACGSVGGSAKAYLQIYDIASNTWTTGTNLPVAVTFAGVTYYNGKVYVHGGMAGSSIVTYMNSYDIATNTWTTITSNSAIARHKMIAYNGIIYSLCGQSSIDYGIGDCYNISANTWEVAPRFRLPIYSGGVVFYNGNAYSIGGLNLTTNLRINNNEIFTIDWSTQ